MAGEFVTQIAVEGVLDEVVLRRVIKEIGGTVGKTYGLEGDDYIRTRIRGYNEASKLGFW